MRIRLLAALACVFVLAPREATSAQEWYEHYLAARDRHIKTGRCEAALRRLGDAIRLKPAPVLGAQTYGLHFIDYLPYYYQGLCYLRMGEFTNAVASFDKEEGYGLIRQRSSLYRDLQRRRQEAKDEIDRIERQRVVQRARESVEAQLRRSEALERTHQYDEALTLLAQAEQAAGVLDTLTQRLVADRIAHLRALKSDRDQREARSRRIDSMLAEGYRLLENGQDQEAIMRFDDVLELDPRNPSAADGKREASEHILARTTRQQRLESFERGKALFEAGHYEAALPFLTQAAADPTNNAALELLSRAQRVVDRLRRQREIKTEIDRRMASGERLLSQGRYAAALVQFQNVLELDPTHTRALERAAHAERVSQTTLFEKWRPNQAPVLTFFQPQSSKSEIAEPTVQIEGVATDDRGLSKLEFFLSQRLVAALPVATRIDGGEPQRHLSFERPLVLSPGLNEVRVRATDVLGISREQSFLITRRLRFYETRAFRLATPAATLLLLSVFMLLMHWRRKRALRTRFNPYIAGAPVMDDNMFFGRQKIVERILSLLPHNSLLITGERRIGKTSLLYHLKRVLESDTGFEHRFFPVFIDLQGLREPAFFETLMSDVLDALPPAADTLAELRFTASHEQYDGRDFAHDLQPIISELVLRSGKHARLVLLIDEVDVLNDYSERTNQLFRSTFMKTFSEHLIAVMCGVGLKRGWHGEGSPWYNFFEQLSLSEFNHEEAKNLIRNPVAGIFRYDNAAVEMILAYSGLKPYLIQRFCIQAVNHMIDKGRTVVTSDDVEFAHAYLKESDGNGRPAETDSSRFMAN